MPMSKSLIPARVNPDLEKERKSPSFSVEEFQCWWHDGADKLKDKREIGKSTRRGQRCNGWEVAGLKCKSGSL